MHCILMNRGYGAVFLCESEVFLCESEVFLCESEYK